MPQPFPRHLKKCNFHIGRVIQERSELSLAGMNVITQYVTLEAALASLFTVTLKTNPGPAVAMLSVIKNNNIRNEALRAAAEVILTGETFQIFEGVLAECEIADKERNRIAHWLWATEDQLPNAVALIDPRQFTSVHQQLQILNSRNKDDVTASDIVAIVDRIRGAALIYNAQDFSTISNHILRTSFLVTTMVVLISYPDGDPEGAKARKMLLDAPEIQRWLARNNSTPPNSAR